MTETAKKEKPAKGKLSKDIFAFAALAVTAATGVVGYELFKPNGEVTTQVLESRGLTDVKTGYGWIFSGAAECSKNARGINPTAFTATYAGQQVSGSVCFDDPSAKTAHVVQIAPGMISHYSVNR